MKSFTLLENGSGHQLVLLKEIKDYFDKSKEPHQQPLRLWNLEYVFKRYSEGLFKINKAKYVPFKSLVRYIVLQADKYDVCDKVLNDVCRLLLQIKGQTKEVGVNTTKEIKAANANSTLFSQ